MAKHQDPHDAKYWFCRSGGDRRGPWLFVIAHIVKPLLWPLTRRTWAGMSNIPLTGGVILACNHVSEADPMTVAHYVYNTGRNPSFLAKDGIFKAPVFGKIFMKAGQIPVYRGGADAVKSLHAAIERVRAGGSVIFYPEGTTSKQNEHWPMRGRTGVARLAMETGAPVIPMTVWGPQRFIDSVRKKLRFRLRNPVTIVAGPPVDLSPWRDNPPDTETLNAMTEAIMLRIRDQLAEIRGETPPPLFDFKASKQTGKDS